MTSAVVFAYHDVGVRCLSVLLAHGVDVALVLTHEDSPGEHIWFDSVAALCARHGIPTITPDDPNTPDVTERIRSIGPDFFFSFYYRKMLGRDLLVLPRRGAFNMHGSLLPKFRGRVPVNWALIKGERETGASLHEMVDKPDAGRLADQMAVPILPDDLASDVFRKVTVAAEIVLDRSLPRLIDGTAELRQQNLTEGSYFGGRKPEDGRIDWTRPAAEIHNLVRAVAPPYPGAFTDIGGGRLTVNRTVRTGRSSTDAPRGCLVASGDAVGVTAVCADGETLALAELLFDGEPLSKTGFTQRFGAAPLLLNKV